MLFLKWLKSIFFAFKVSNLLPDALPNKPYLSKVSIWLTNSWACRLGQEGAPKKTLHLTKKKNYMKLVSPYTSNCLFINFTGYGHEKRMRLLSLAIVGSCIIP